MAEITFKDGLATSAGEVMVYNYRPDGEYVGNNVEYIPAGVGIPANSTLTPAPETREEEVAVWNGEFWELMADLRGDVVYRESDGNPSVVDYLGNVHEGFTCEAPQSPYDKWDGNRWVKDETQEKAALRLEALQQKSSLLTEASTAIAPLQDAVDLDIATDAEITSLAAWKKYRVLLNRVDTEKAPDITWPEIPF